MNATVQPALPAATSHADEIEELCELVSLSIPWRKMYVAGFQRATRWTLDFRED